MRSSYIQSLLIAFMLFIGLPLAAQELTVKSMEFLPDDPTARLFENQREDGNGTVAGIVKVIIALDGVVFDGASLMHQEKRGMGEYWVWMADRATKLTVRTPNYQPLEINFRNYDFQMVHSKNTYKLVITVPTAGVQQDDKGILAFKVEPKDAILTVNGVDQSLQNGQFSQLVEKGSYSYELKASGYSPKRGTVQVGDNPEVVTVRLQPLQTMASTLQVSCATAGAQVYLDSQPQGAVPQTLTLTKGAHRLEVRLQGYRTYREDITVGENDRLRRDIPALAKATGRLAVTYLPLESDVYIDGSKVGQTPATIRDIAVGSHQLEIRKDGYTPSRRDVVVRDNEMTEVSGSLVAVEAANEQPAKEETANVPVAEEKDTNMPVNDKDDNGPVTVDGIEYEYKTPTVDQIKEWAKKNASVCASRIPDLAAYHSVPKDMVNNHPCLVYLILTSKSISEIKERQSWFDLYSLMNEEQINKLYDILYREHYKLRKIAEGGDGTTGKDQTHQTDEDHAAISPTAPIANVKKFTVKGVSFNMVCVEGGTFQMGATMEQAGDSGDDERPIHEVTLGDFMIGQTEVTQELWEAVMGTTVRDHRDKASPQYPLYGEGKDYPMYYVSWNECKEFISKLNELTHQQFRLPTEAEWEYAARGANKFKRFKYSGANLMKPVGWYWQNSGDRFLDGTDADLKQDNIKSNNGMSHPVGTKQANALGLYDMSGNVWEWCEDWYGAYPTKSQKNPKGPKTGSSRVFRGGCWSSAAKDCRVSVRYYNSPDRHFSTLGFRLAL